MDEQAQFQAILDELNRRAALDPQLRQIMKKIEKGKANFTDTAALSQRMGNLLGELFGAEILDIPEDAREAVCVGLLQEQYDSINETLADVQETLDGSLGLHLTPQKAPFPSERVQQLAHSLLDPTVKPETLRRRADKPVATVAKSFHDDYIKTNAKLRSRLGFKCYLTRVAAAGCCKWCTDIAGRYVYGDHPDDIFRRHDNCDCTVTFENGRERQDVWSKRTWQESPAEVLRDASEPVRYSAEQSERLQNTALSRLTLSGERDIINTKPVRISMQTFGNRSIPRMSDRELQKSIESWTKRAEEHKEYIENPNIHCPDWESYDPRKQAGLKQHWEKEIRNFNEDIQAALDELERREKS